MVDLLLNKRRPLPLKFFCALVLGLSACQPPGSQARPEMESLRRAVDDVRSSQADQGSRLDSIQTELRELQGRLEQLEHSADKQIGADISQMKKDVGTLSRRVPPPAIVPVLALEQDENISNDMPPEIGTPFAQALQKLREGAFDDALPLLEESFDRAFAADSSFAPQVLFWSGVAHDGVGDNKNALKAYHEFLTRFAKHPRAPLALLRQASVFVRLGDNKTAKITLRKVVADFPKSSEAFQAKDKLKSLGG